MTPETVFCFGENFGPHRNAAPRHFKPFSFGDTSASARLPGEKAVPRKKILSFRDDFCPRNTALFGLWLIPKLQRNAAGQAHSNRWTIVDKSGCSSNGTLVEGFTLQICECQHSGTAVALPLLPLVRFQGVAARLLFSRRRVKKAAWSRPRDFRTGQARVHM